MPSECMGYEKGFSLSSEMLSALAPLREIHLTSRLRLCRTRSFMVKSGKRRF